MRNVFWDKSSLSGNKSGALSASTSLQRRAARIIMQTDSSDDALERLEYDTLELRREIHIVKLLKKVFK